MSAGAGLQVSSAFHDYTQCILMLTTLVQHVSGLPSKTEMPACVVSAQPLSSLTAAILVLQLCVCWKSLFTVQLLGLMVIRLCWQYISNRGLLDHGQS